MKLKIICDCGNEYEIFEYDIYIRDTTPCSCGCCHGEQYEIDLGKCPKCNKENIIIK